MQTPNRPTLIPRRESTNTAAIPNTPTALFKRPAKPKPPATGNKR